MSENLIADSDSEENKNDETIEVSNSPLGNKKAGGRSQGNLRIEKPEDLQEWSRIPPEVHSETIRTENTTRKWLAYSIILVFVLWSISGGIYLMFFKGNIQELIAGSALISGPLGVVIGYYFGAGDDRRR